MFYSAKTKGFYNTEINGESIPEDAIEIDNQDYLDLLDQQSKGKIIDFDYEKNKPIAIDPPKPTDKDLLIIEILVLESTVTQRRIREAIIGKDNGWLSNVESQIAALREKL